jgi:TonB family protein
MDKWEEDIKRYHAGEMTPQEQHELEKKALSDPFLFEALEGTESISETELTNDLKEIDLKINSRATEQQSFGLAGSASKKAARAETVAKEKIILKSQPKWLWPLRIAASILLLIAVYFSITPLFEKEDQQLAQQKPMVREKSQEKENKISDTTSHQTDQLAAVSESKPVVIENKKSKSTEVIDSQKIKDKQETSPAFAAAPVQKDPKSETEIAADEEVAKIILESPAVVVTEEKQAELKKESSQVSRSKVASGFISNQKIIKGKVLSADDGTPLPGVNIVIKGTTTGTVTDMQGNYQIISELQNPTLVYSFIGLQTEEVNVANQSELNVDLQTDISQLSEVVVTGYSPVKSDLDREPVIKLAEPEGGRRAYDKYLKNSLQYPQQALDNKIKGRVTIQFTVSTDGSLSDFSVFKGLGYGCDEEVIRMVKEGPKWSPTTEDNVAVESEVRVRVKFALPN